MVTLSAEIPADARIWRNTTAVRRWCRQYTLIDQAQHAKWLERISVDPTVKMFGVWAMDVGHVGVAGLTSIDHVNQTAEFSLYIAPSKQRNGYGKQALLALLSHGFKDFNLNRIWGETFDGNPAMRLFESIGMEVEGKQREAYFRDGKFVDAFIVSMLRKDFYGKYSSNNS